MTTTVEVYAPAEVVTVEEFDGEVIISEVDTETVVEVGLPGPQGDPGPGVPDGGDTGQILAKSTSDDYDTEWFDGLTVFEAAGAAGSAVGSHVSSYHHYMFLGAWSGSTTYYPDAIVSLNDALWICLSPNTNKSPDGPEGPGNWDLLINASLPVETHESNYDHSAYALRSEMPALIKATETAVPEGNNSVALGTSKCQIEWIRITTTSTDWTLTIYSKSDYASGAFIVVTNRSGNHDIQLGLPYQDESAASSLHYNFTSASGSETHSIEIRGVTLQ